MFQQITILGTGLLGASIAMAVRKHSLSERIVSWSRSPHTRARCADAEWCDQVHESPAKAVEGSGLVVLCTPVQTIVPLLAEIAPRLDKDSIVTDVGSTKQNICAGAQALQAPGFTFIGSHPMAGSEQSGMDSARSDLFSSAACILTPEHCTPAEKTARLRSFWEKLGMTIHEMSPRQHDETIAHISHLPHLLATTLCNALTKKPQDWALLAGGGLRDTTRIAAGDPALWRQILSDNREAVLQGMEGLEKELAAFRRILAENDEAALQKALASGKAYREGLRP